MIAAAARGLQTFIRALQPPAIFALIFALRQKLPIGDREKRPCILV
jgi:hypothetical protein